MSDLVYKKLIESEQTGKRSALCIITKTAGSTPRKISSKMIVYEDASIFGTIGGGSLEKKVIEDALIAIQKLTPVLVSYELEEDLSMICGGNVEVFIEPTIPISKLFIFGAGHIGRILALFASESGFEVTLIDERTGIFDSFQSSSYHLINKAFPEAIPILNFDNNTFITVVSHQHSKDIEASALCIEKPKAYLGMIGSRRKVAEAKEIFKNTYHLSDELIAKIDMPIGMPMNCETPAEIAVSILAKMIDIKRKKN